MLTLLEYKVTDEPLDEKYSPIIGEKIQQAHSLVFKDPKQAIKELEILIKKHPHIPTFYNYISVAYERIGDKEKAEFWTYENYKKHPNYLFAKTNLASVYLEKKEIGKVEELFEGKLELKLLYPNRKVFHTTEIIAFFGVIGHYYFLKDMRKQAEMHYKMIKQLNPNHPFTLLLKEKLHPFLYWCSLRAIVVIVKYVFLFFALIILLPFSLISSFFKVIMGKSVKENQNV